MTEEQKIEIEWEARYCLAALELAAESDGEPAAVEFRTWAQYHADRAWAVAQS